MLKKVIIYNNKMNWLVKIINYIKETIVPPIEHDVEKGNVADYENPTEIRIS